MRSSEQKNMFKNIAQKPLAMALCAALLISAQSSVALTITAVTSDNGYPAHKVQWTDSAGLTRTAIMVDQNPTTPPYTGYLRQYTYQVGGQPRICTGTENYATGGDLEFSGDGFVQNHTAGGADWSSGNGAGFPGTTTIVLQGASHAIIEYYMANYEIDGPYSNPSQIFVPTTVAWFFADGRDHPIFAVAQDATHAGGNLGADSRSPYGDMAYDGYNTTGDVTGASSYDAYVGGASYGDNYKFVTLPDTGAVTTNSAWEAITANTIPYAMQWAQDDTSGGATAVDAEMGHVATLPGSIYDQGEDCQVLPIFDPRTQDEPAGPMLQDESWAFQILGFQWPSDGSATPITEKRLTWGRNFGSVGGFDEYGSFTTGLTNYSEHWTDPIGEALSGTRADGSLMAYSTFIVLGQHHGSYTGGAVGQQVTQMENVAQAGLTASVGTKATTGPAGVGTAAAARTITYSPPGFNPTYAAWEISASANEVTATLTPASGHPLASPVFVIDNYTKTTLPSSISVNGSSAGSGYYASVDTAGQRLWITVNASVTSASPLDLVVSQIPGPNITMFSPTNGTTGTMVTITGTALSGATAVTFNGVSAAINTDSSTSISTTVPAGATTGPIDVTTPGGTAVSPNAFEPQYTLGVGVAPSASDGTASAGGIVGGGTLAGGSQTLAATANDGFAFTDWTLGGTIASTSPNYDITLTSNVTYVANFLPACTLTLTATPADGGTVSGAGTFPTNSMQTAIATPNSGFVFSNWTQGATVLSTDTNYTFELTNNETLTANFATAPGEEIQGILTIITNGQGTLTDNIGNKVLKAGDKITFKATPASGQVFVDWTGSTNSTKNPLVFTLEANSVVQANFIPNPFLPTKGIYNGLFFGTNGVTEQTAGMLKNLNLTSKGAYSGALLINGASHGISGSFSYEGLATNHIARSVNQGGPLTLVMNLQNPGTSAPQITGSVSNSAWLVTNLTANISSNTLSPAEYTMLLLPDTNNAPPTSSPGGDGYVLITNAAGTARISGALADGTAYTQTVPIAADGSVPIYANLYGGKGLLLGWINLGPTNSAGVGLTWIRGGARSGLYSGGFTNILLTNQILLSLWTNSPSAALLAGLTNLTLLDTIGDTNVLTNVTVSVSGSTVTGISDKVTGTVNGKTGLLKVVVGSGPGKVSGFGAVLPKGGYAGGYFLTKTNAQAITLGQ
jgi:hypothetical protein